MAAKKLIEPGTKFGHLTVIREVDAPEESWKFTNWECQCDCGRHHTVRGTNLRKGVTTRCQSCAASAGVETRQTTDGENVIGDAALQMFAMEIYAEAVKHYRNGIVEMEDIMMLADKYMRSKDTT